MDKRGHEALNAALADVEFGATILPAPAEDENIRYLTIKISEQVVPAEILNALGKASLIETSSNDYEDAVPQYQPSLKLLGITPGELTFEDVNTQSWGY